MHQSNKTSNPKHNIGCLCLCSSLFRVDYISAGKWHSANVISSVSTIDYCSIEVL